MARGENLAFLQRGQEEKQLRKKRERCSSKGECWEEKNKVINTTPLDISDLFTSL